MTITADQLRRARRTAGITQAKLAEDTGVNATLIKHFETFRINALPQSAQDALVEYFKERGVDLGADDSGTSTTRLESGVTRAHRIRVQASKGSARAGGTYT